jgi:hypothetical protein
VANPKKLEEHEAPTRLEEVFGVQAAALQDVVMQGLLARTTVTPHHPKTYAGTAQWADTVRALRDKLVPAGWRSHDENNCPLVVHPAEKLMIAVQTGDKETGTSGIPSNRAPKGSVTESAVVSNFRQLSLFDYPDLPDISDDSGRVLWILLYHLSPLELRYELSLPLEMVGGKIRSWKERIVFTPIRLDGTDIELGDDDGEEFDVPIQRKPTP